ncbi:MAG: hypothetical protein GY757_34030 [bacterium]|nr:hypothetical protein [bacterium]
MMNNKYVAIGLSIAAVILVVYQVYSQLNKNKNLKPAVVMEKFPGENMPGSQPPGPQSRPASRPAMNPPTTSAGSSSSDEEGLDIDYHSPILLKKVSDNPVEKYSRQEMIQTAGVAFFQLPQEEVVEEVEDKKTGEVVEVQFILNSIVIDKERRLAVVNDSIVKTGDIINGARVMSIQKSRVVLKIKDKTIVLSTTSRIKLIKLVGGNGEY